MIRPHSPDTRLKTSLLRWLKQFRNLLLTGSTCTSKTIQHRRGKRGEDLAARYLRKTTRLKILLRNWSNGREEIDIIAREGKVLVFVEVRARSATAKVSGYYSINAKKRQHLRRAAYQYLRTLNPRPRTYRYDVVELGMEGQTAVFIRHHRNVSIF